MLYWMQKFMKILPKFDEILTRAHPSRCIDFLSPRRPAATRSTRGALVPFPPSEELSGSNPKLLTIENSSPKMKNWRIHWFHSLTCDGISDKKIRQNFWGKREKLFRFESFLTECNAQTFQGSDRWLPKKGQWSTYRGYQGKHPPSLRNKKVYWGWFSTQRRCKKFNCRSKRRLPISRSVGRGTAWKNFTKYLH